MDTTKFTYCTWPCRAVQHTSLKIARDREFERGEACILEAEVLLQESIQLQDLKRRAQRSCQDWNELHFNWLPLFWNQLQLPTLYIVCFAVPMSQTCLLQTCLGFRIIVLKDESILESIFRRVCGKCIALFKITTFVTPYPQLLFCLLQESTTNLWLE